MRCKDCVVGLFSVCQGDYCSAERSGLIELAQAAAEYHGHTLDEFVKLKDRPTWEARCLRCGLSATICLDPECAGQDLTGPALSEPCRTGFSSTSARPG